MCANLCRICGRITEEKYPIDLFQIKNKDLLHKIRNLTGIRLKKEETLPKVMCSVCKKDLNDAYNFRQNFLKVQASFKAKNSNKYKKPTNKGIIEATEFVQVYACKEERSGTIGKQGIHAEHEEKEIFIFDTINLNKSNNCSKEKADEVNALELNPYEVSTVLEPKFVKEEFFCESNDEILDVSKDISGDEDKVDDEFKQETEILASTTLMGKHEKMKSSNHKSKDENSKLKEKSKKKRKGSEDHPNVFICDQCGNHFTCRHHFKLHLRRHTGDKRCACELCPDKFFTSSELRRHMRRHTGERPFACKHCERRFTDYSTRIKHERTHTNERPFMCSQCGKSFTTSYILKNHMLTHTGERQFKCDICNRAFTRRTHLVVHFRSIMHKQAAEKGKRPTPLEEFLKEQSPIHQPANNP